MNAARPLPGETIARFSDLPGDGGVAVDFSKDGAWFSMIVLRKGERVFGYENRCPHANYPLQRPDGHVVVRDGYIICTGHAASFTLEEGACAGGPCNGEGLTPIALERDGDLILLSLPLLRPARGSDRDGGV